MGLRQVILATVSFSTIGKWDARAFRDLVQPAFRRVRPPRVDIPS